MEQVCMNCRYVAREGCRRNVCAAVRALWRGRGITPPAAPVLVAAPEPLGRNGEAGYLVMWGGITREFPPTEEGLKKALDLVDELGEVGITATIAEIYPDRSLKTQERQETEAAAPVVGVYPLPN